MKRAILTVNFNNFLCENSRASMLHAADRWGVRYMEWTEETAPNYSMHPARLPCAAFIHTDLDEVLILDGDTLVSIECPNMFEVFAGEELIAVQNGNPERFGDYSSIKACEIHEYGIIASSDERFRNLIWEDEKYWNSGVILARRKQHEAMFALALELALNIKQLGWHQQSCCNAAASILGVSVRLVPESFNYIHGFDFVSTGAYILHFAGHTGRERLLPIIQWQ